MGEGTNKVARPALWRRIHPALQRGAGLIGAQGSSCAPQWAVRPVTSRGVAPLRPYEHP